MKRFRLFRSRAFWFGVPGLVFLLWGWGDSLVITREAYFYRQRFLLWHGDSRTVVHVLPGVGWMPSNESGIGFNRYAAEPFKWPCLPAPTYEDHGENRMRTVQLPHWLLIVIYVAVWAGLLILRKRKYEQRPVE